MTPNDRQAILRAIPPVDEILAHPPVAAIAQSYPQLPLTMLVREALDMFRSLKKAPQGVDDNRDTILAWIERRIRDDVEELRSGGQRTVLNGTGVALHTNLGRAVVGPGAAEAALQALGSYVTLEVDIETGARGPRSVTLNRLLAICCGAESGMVVNNNAAAVYLVANAFSPPGRVIISRGELVEIGGSFRLPEILRHAAAEVVEVGTTNRTYASDYAGVAREGDLILKVHKSNYTIEGFAHDASVSDLVAVARNKKCHVVYDMGSGALFDFRERGIGDDEPVAEVLASGVDGVTMSGDKLMGGIQAGLIVGRRDFIARLKQNPLRRAVRVDKVTVAVFQETLRQYLFAADPSEHVPVIRQILGDRDGDRRRATGVLSSLPDIGGMTVSVEEDRGVVGGGSLAAEEIESASLRIRCDSEEKAERLARVLRRHEPPVFTRIKGADVGVNFTTILRGQEEQLADAIASAMKSLSQ